MALIQLVAGDLLAADRTKIISLITMDVHSCNVVNSLIARKTEGLNAFAWQKQMRIEWEQHHTIDRSMLHYSDNGSQIASRRCPSGARRKGKSETMMDLHAHIIPTKDVGDDVIVKGSSAITKTTRI